MLLFSYSYVKFLVLQELLPFCCSSRNSLWSRGLQCQWSWLFCTNQNCDKQAWHEWCRTILHRGWHSYRL